MSGRKKNTHIRDRINLLLFGSVGLILLLFYEKIVYLVGNFLAVLLILGFVFWILLKLSKTPYGKKIAKKFSIDRAVVTVKSFARHIPPVVWGGFAVFGIFIFGLFIGLAYEDYSPTEKDTHLVERQEDFSNLIIAYEEIIDLFLYQNQDAEIMSDYDMLLEHPNEVLDAIRSYNQKREEIIFQAGRIMELRRKAGLSVEDKL